MTAEIETQPTQQSPALDRNASTPLWIQFRDTVRSNILSGVWATDAKLPTEAEFGEQFGISRIVVREALADLVRSGLIYKIRGQGAFARTNATRTSSPPCSPPDERPARD